MSLKYSCLQTIFSMSECAKTHLQQSGVEFLNFLGGTPGSPLQMRPAGGLIYWNPRATESQLCC